MLALHGGEPIYQGRWPMWPRGYNEMAAEQLGAVLSSHRWTIRGWHTGEPSKQTIFARKFAAYSGAAHCSLASSGSTSLLVALEACDIGYGDEVIVPVYTWIATAIAVVNVNAIPVFVDVDPRTGCIDPQQVKNAITPRSRAIIPVHLHCALADMDVLTDIAQEHQLSVIEDCAQAHGARIGGRHVGTFGHVGAFSMNQEKLLCCGEGGAVIANNEAIADRLGRLRADGGREMARDLVLGEYELVDMPGLMGANYCMSDFQAAVLLGQLDTLDRDNEQRAENAHYLNQHLAELEGLIPIETTAKTSTRTFYKYAIRRAAEAFAGVPTEIICRALSAELGFTVEQTECQPLHQNMLYCPASKRRHHLGEDYLRRIDVSELRFPVAEDHYKTTLTFHHRILLGSKQQMDMIIEAFRKIHKHAGDLRKELDRRHA